MHTRPTTLINYNLSLSSRHATVYVWVYVDPELLLGLHETIELLAMVLGQVS